MFFWFVGTAAASVWFIFGDPQFNYRYVIAGAVAPDIIEVWFGKAGPLHSVVTSVVLLTIVMLTTIGARPRRKQWLAGVIGVFLHLVYDGAFLDTRMFWWPLGGFNRISASLPSVSRGWWNVPLEIVGVLLWIWVRRRVNKAKVDVDHGTLPPDP